MASQFFNPFFTKLFSGEFDFSSGSGQTFKVALVTSLYVFDKTHDFFNDITNEISGTGYTSGGKALTSVDVTQNDADNLALVDADDIEWASSTISNARAAILYKDTGVASTSPLIRYFDFGEDRSTSSSTFELRWSALGLFDNLEIVT